MASGMRADRRGEGGQAAAEFVAVVPALLLAVAVALQLGLLGWTAWSASEAARVGARAGLVGDDVGDAARAALPGLLRERAQIDDGPVVDVTLRAPSLVPGLPGFAITGSAGLNPASG